jgi:serine/threonine protein kinase
MEYVPGGTIRSCLSLYGKFAETVTKSFTAQVLDGLAYLHSKQLVHRVSLTVSQIVTDVDA